MDKGDEAVSFPWAPSRGVTPAATLTDDQWKKDLREILEEVLGKKFSEVGIGSLLNPGVCATVPSRNIPSPQEIPLAGSSFAKPIRTWQQREALEGADLRRGARAKTTNSNKSVRSGGGGGGAGGGGVDNVLPFCSETDSNLSRRNNVRLGTNTSSVGGGPASPRQVKIPPVRWDAKIAKDVELQDADRAPDSGDQVMHLPGESTEPEEPGGVSRGKSSQSLAGAATMTSDAFHSMMPTAPDDDDMHLRELAGMARKKTIAKIIADRMPRKSLPANLQEGDMCRIAAAHVVLSQKFDWFVCGLIFLNAGSIGIQTDYIARNDTQEVPGWMTGLETVFGLLFVLELTIRLFVYRCQFFSMTGWMWNWFDCIVVGLQVFEEILSLAGANKEGESLNFSFTRVLRLLRLIRVIRLARILRLIRELRVLVSSITNSLKSLVWTVLLLLLMIYSVSLCITQLVSDHFIDKRRENVKEDIVHFYGTLPRCMLSLFQAISGGVDWDTLIVPLIEDVSPFLAALFILYIAFAFLAIMNVVTGVFVDSVLVSAKADKESFLLNNARELFETLDEEMDWEAFEAKIETPQMQEFFKGIDVDPDEAKGIFQLLDLDESGSVNADEFFSGCVRLRGPAKALDSALMLRHMEKMKKQYGVLVEHLLAGSATAVGGGANKPDEKLALSFTPRGADPDS